MQLSRTALVAGALALLAACGGSDGPTPPTAAKGMLRVVNATGSLLEVKVDGQSRLTGLTVARVSDPLEIPVGSHTIRVQTGAGTFADLSVDMASGRTTIAVARPATNGLAADEMIDTGAVVPAGKSKLRVAHLAGNTTGIEIWRTQPDWQTPVHIMTPFDYEDVSPYLQSDPGAWEVFVTAAGTTGPKLATTGSVNVPDGQRRTVVLLDSAGVLRFGVIDN